MGGGETIDPSRQESNDLLQGSFGILGQCNSSCWWISTHSYWRLTVRGKQSLRKHEPGSVCQWIISRCVAWTPDLCSDSWSKGSLFVLCSRWHCGGHWLCFLSSLLCVSPPLQPQISFILFSTSVLSSVDNTSWQDGSGRENKQQHMGKKRPFPPLLSQSMFLLRSCLSAHHRNTKVTWPWSVGRKPKKRRQPKTMELKIRSPHPVPK